jgi:hypothetical protein
MTDAEYEQWVATLRIRGDEAYLPGERAPRKRGWNWHPLTDEERLHYSRDRSRRLRADPAYRAREREARRRRRLARKAIR